MLRQLRRSSGIDSKGQRASAEAVGLSGELSAVDGQHREKGSWHSKQLHIAAHIVGGPGSGLEIAKWLIRGGKLCLCIKCHNGSVCGGDSQLNGGLVLGLGVELIRGERGLLSTDSIIEQ